MPRRAPGPDCAPDLILWEARRCFSGERESNRGSTFPCGSAEKLKECQRVSGRMSLKTIEGTVEPCPSKISNCFCNSPPQKQRSEGIERVHQVLDIDEQPGRQKNSISRILNTNGDE